MLPETGHCTSAPILQVPLELVVIVDIVIVVVVVVAVVVTTVPEEVQSVTFVLFTHPEKSLLADGHGNVPPPEPAKPGQHWSPAHMLPEPGHCTSAPILQVPLELVVIVDIVIVVVVAVVVTTVPEEVQSVTFVLFTQPEKPLLAEGHGNVSPQEPAKPGQPM